MGKQLCGKGPGGPDGHYVELGPRTLGALARVEPAVEGGDRSPLLSPGETTSGPHLGSRVEESIGFPELSLSAMTLPATNAYVLTLISLGCKKGEVSLIGGKK